MQLVYHLTYLLKNIHYLLLMFFENYYQKSSIIFFSIQNLNSLQKNVFTLRNTKYLH